MTAATTFPRAVALEVRDECLCFAAQRTARELARRFDRLFAGLGITNGQFSMMVAMGGMGGPKLGELANFLGMDHATVTAAVRNLEKRGLVALRPDGADRRARRVSITAAGTALIAKAVNGPPVQVVWTRADDLRHDFYRQCAIHRLEATLGPDGNPIAMRHRFSSPAIDATGGKSGKFGAGESDGIGNHVYRVPNRSSEYTLLDSGVPRGWWRAVNTTHGTFALESFIDELAAKAGKDPYEYRMALIDRWVVDQPQDSKEFPFNPERYKATLTLAAEKAGWGKPLPAGHALGIAHNVPDHLTYAAEVVEASVTNGKVNVHRVVVAVDCGRVFNPDGARAQLEGGVVQALSAALGEEITIEGGAKRLYKPFSI